MISLPPALIDFMQQHQYRPDPRRQAETDFFAFRSIRKQTVTPAATSKFFRMVKAPSLVISSQARR